MTAKKKNKKVNYRDFCLKTFKTITPAAQVLSCKNKGAHSIEPELSFRSWDGFYF